LNLRGRTIQKKKKEAGLKIENWKVKERSILRNGKRKKKELAFDNETLLKERKKTLIQHSEP